MFKRLLLLSLALMLVGSAFAVDGLHYLTPTKITKGTPDGPEIDEANFFISRYSDPNAEYYLGSGSAGDTMCVHFQPLAPCEVYFAEIQWFSAGPYQAFVWEYSDGANDMYADGRSPERGTSTVSPLGDILFGPFNTSAEGTQDWEYMFTQDDLLNGDPIWLEDGRSFVVGYVKTTDDGLPQPLADDVSSRGFTYTWFGGPWMADYDNPWGSYSSDFTGTIVDVMMRVGVDYPQGAPPIITGMNQLPNTLATDKTCTVQAEIIDDNGWDGDEAWLYVQMNDDAPMSYEMLDDDGDDIFMADFTLDAAVGDVVKYWIEATDDEDQVNSNEDNLLFFDIIEMTQLDADILVIDHGSEFQAQLKETLYMMDWYYAFYDVDANKGIDYSVTTANNWSAIYVFGWGASSVPTRDYTGNGYVDYLQNEGNLFFSDQDYFYGNGEDAAPEFEAGDFAYDVFGIASGGNDPYADPLEADTSFFGDDNDLTGDFMDDPFVLYFGVDRPDNVWTDDVEGVAEAMELFIGEMNGNLNGLAYENGWGGKTVYLGFDVAMAIDRSLADMNDWRMTDQFQTLMTNVNTWFGATDAPEPVEAANPVEFGLAQNYPNPFNPTTAISFTLPQTSDVTLAVFNTAGQQVATLVNGQMNAGQQMVSFDASNLASGLYFYTLQAGEFSATKKMMLLK